MKPTIRDVADAANVSTATVDRVLNGRAGVRAANRHRVYQAAADLGYLPATGALAMPTRAVRVEFILPVAGNRFLADLASHIEDYCDRLPLISESRVHRLETMRPQEFASAIEHLDAATVGVGIVAVDDPVTRQAVASLADADLRVVTIASDLPTTPRANYVGIDNCVAGRIAGRLMGRVLGSRPATVALFIGSRHYHGHDQREHGFRSVLGSQFPAVTVSAAVEVDDDSRKAYRATLALLEGGARVDGIYVAGGGKAGVIRALEERRPALTPLVICHDLTDQTRKALNSGIVEIVIDQNARLMAEQSAIQLLGSLASTAPYLTKKLIEPRIITCENIPQI